MENEMRPHFTSVGSENTMSAQIAQQQNQLMQIAVHGPSPKLYANSFMVAVSPSDVSVVLLMNGAVIGTVVLAHSALKSLHSELGNAIKLLEAALGGELKNLAEIDVALKSSGANINAA